MSTCLFVLVFRAKAFGMSSGPGGEESFTPLLSRRRRLMNLESIEVWSVCGYRRCFHVVDLAPVGRAYSPCLSGLGNLVVFFPSLL
jgi:hypothetical protein